jgi:HEAT repeat protein
MNLPESDIKKEFEQLKFKNADEKVRFLESLFDSNLTEEQLFYISELVFDEDKGVRNSVSFLIINNSNEKIAAKIVPLTSSGDISIRNFAGELLIKIGSKAVNPILEYIDSGNDDEKKFLIDVLGLIGDGRASAKITRILNSVKNENVILACIEALGNLKSEKSLYHIMSFYGLNDLYKPVVIESLGKIGSPAALGFISSKYEEEIDELVKFSIIESFGSIGDEETFFFLLAELNEVKGALVWPIIKSIYNLKEKFRLDIPFDERMKDIILQTVLEADAEYKKIAASLLMVFNDKEVISVYLKILGNDAETDEIIAPKFWENPKLTFEIISEMMSQQTENVKELLNLLKDIIQLDGEEKYHLAPSLQLRNLTDSLSRFLSDHDEEIRILALELLFILDKNIAVLFADDFCGDTNLWNRLKLVEILEEVIHPKADEALLKLANDAEEMVRERASYCLAKRNFQSKLK